MIAACAAAVLAIIGGVYTVNKDPRSQITANAGPAASRSPAKPAGAARDTAAAPAMPPSSLGTNWKQKFSVNFSGSRLDTSVWGTCYPWESQAGCANLGNSNEYQWYMPSQDQVGDGALHLVAERDPITGGSKEYPFRSGMVTTFPGYRFQYGYIEAVARVPTAKGLWSALWLAAADKSWPPEIDILEHWDAQSKYWQYYHPKDAPRERASVAAPDLAGWHKFGLYWDSSEIVWFVDGRQAFRAVRNVPQEPMYFIANVAVDAPNATLASGNSLDLKSVRVWQHE